MGAIVTSHKTLAKMEELGFIVRNGKPGETERHWTGARVPVITVKEGKALKHWNEEFEYKGAKYRLKYFDGCFHPFVIKVGEPLPSWV